ncbi:hypothetical protein RMCBS344292_06838 [Rhizopus microsporus]|nr:hypothetical protein RMCBS344292_06838 [Rhizopus microsporus]
MNQIRKDPYWKKADFFYDKEKLLLISFGNGMFGKDQVKIKTHRVDVIGVLYQQLKKRQKSGELLLAMMDEFRTSKVCHPCQDMTLTTTMIDLRSVLTCKSCGIMWQLGLNAFKNIFKIIGFKIDLRLLFRHNNRDIDICAVEIASHDGDNKIIDDEGKPNRESKDILDNLISIIPRKKSNVSMGWSVQIGGSSCFFSGIHLGANGLYLKVPKFQFALPSTIADLDNYTDVLSKLLTFRKPMYCIAIPLKSL